MVMDEAAVRRFAHVMSLVARLEAYKAEIEAMRAHGGYSEESFLEISHRMEDIAEELGSLGGV